MSTQPLLDSLGRRATDLRVSLTDRCNLRCRYCMPAEGLPVLPPGESMTADEIVRLVGLAVASFGVREVRFTGGEPLLRADLVDIVAACAALEQRPELSLTTNAVGLASRAAGLRAAGLDRLNISLDTIREDTFAALTRRPFLRQVLAGIAAAREAGFARIKINAVLLRGINDDQALELLDWALAEGHELRFIEQMPLDADRSWARDELVTAEEIRRRLGAKYVFCASTDARGGSPAEVLRVFGPGADGEHRELGTIGIIASVTENFCAACTRTRLTADGHVRSCLFSQRETDLLGSMRAGATDAELARLWREAMWTKPAGHGLDAGAFATGSFVQPERTMSAIGG